MLKKVIIRNSIGGVFVLPLAQDEIKKLLDLCSGRKNPDKAGMFDINTLITDKEGVERKIDTQMWVKLRDIVCIEVEPLSNLSLPPEKKILEANQMPKPGA